MQLASRSVASKFGAHSWVVGILVSLATALSLLLWLHPTAGVIRDGILKGMDVRYELIQILWWHLLVFVAVSTAVAAIAPVRWGAVRHWCVYFAGMAATVAANPILDKYF